MKKILKLFNYSISVITAILYVYTLGWLFMYGEYRKLVFAISIPFIGVVLCSIARIVINAPRPYEVYDFDNLIDKKTVGKSFPSRHVYSIFVIAMTIFLHIRPLGILLFVMGVALMFFRVYSKVHFPRDVIAGAIFGIVTGAIGYLFI